jgi:hypothetical protein
MRQMVATFVYMSYKTKKETQNILHEPMVAYGSMGTMPSFYNLLGGANALTLNSDFDIITLARQGFP